MDNFLTTNGLDKGTLENLIESAINFKNSRWSIERPIGGRSVALVFFNPSLRTRASMQIGIHELGGNSVVLEPGSTSWTLEHRESVVMDGDKTEHIKEFVQVLERYVSAIGVRTFAALKNWEEERMDPILNAFAKYASVPVINLESAMHHPLQAMADIMTIRENLGKSKKKVLLTWAWHPKPLPMAVPNSFALAAAQFGHDVRIAHPRGFELDEELLNEIELQAEMNGGSVEYSNNINESFDGADVVYAKSWGSKHFYGDRNGDIRERSAYRDKWIVDEPKMAKTKNAVFMHCLPVRRNVIVTDAVIDSPNSIVLDQAENRLHIQKAILTELFK
ncbi:N-acetylornithine carbamoyltransferase [Leptolyngbya sp. 7M]|uniref:N-acetylornithine carbamoyltransferase n=1 Tax=Leptolyngbya sp. 7M TaxID=2812896 RepID=UPI001B8CC9E3|nr:N-acetylornithine carbamoyltransferase [Leptolyngbya sp. 7M]QYO65576.1 N-acetylornithine carbamoyltransferase [Leptolyngbya sp. 7M]